MKHAQRGAILPLFVISLLAIVGVAALAIDSGHAYLNKARLQNALDSAALAGAKVYDDTGNSIAAAMEARTVFNATANSIGNEEIADAIENIEVTVSFSSTLVPFTSGAVGPYVRVRATGFGSDNWFAGLFGVNSFDLGGTAVAGPSPSLDRNCNVAPMMACGDPSLPPQEGNTDLYGYTRGQVQVLKLAANDPSAIGPGNFQLINLEGMQGGRDIREAMAGSMEACVSSGEDMTINTKPGNTVGPAVTGINTRLGIYHDGTVSPDRHPPDWVTTRDSDYDETDYLNQAQPSFDLDDYMARTLELATNPPATGLPGRRILRIPIGNCSGAPTGAGQMQLLGIGCFFLIRDAENKGNEAQIYGQFMDNCGGMGTPGPNPGSGVGPHIIQLYHDPDSVES